MTNETYALKLHEGQGWWRQFAIVDRSRAIEALHRATGAVVAVSYETGGVLYNRQAEQHLNDDTRAQGTLVEADGEPLFLWWVDAGSPRLGTLQQYAETVENAHYSGLDIDGPYIVRGGPGNRTVEAVEGLERTSYEGDDYLHVTLSFEGAQASYRIDLRA